jgi:hypothetical protein
MQWRTRDGKTLDVKDMTDRHLQNTIAYMQRRLDKMQDCESAAWGFYSTCRGDAAVDAMESTISQMDEAISQVQFKLQGLQMEQKRRAGQEPCGR